MVFGCLDMLFAWKIVRQYADKLCIHGFFALCIVEPDYILWFNEYLYVGQGAPVPWHNPTSFEKGILQIGSNAFP